VAKEIQDDRSEELERTLGQWLVRIGMLFARSSSRASVVVPGGSEQFRDVLFRWSALAILADRDGSDGVATVKGHVHKTFEKLNVCRRGQAVAVLRRYFVPRRTHSAKRPWLDEDAASAASG
jgi:hypothetical protein